jgi:hypothetical protein
MNMPTLGRMALFVWWASSGRPRGGLVFPSRCGERVGEAKIKVSHAEAFRRDLARAWGLETWDAKAQKFVAARAMTEREREVLQGGEYTLPVDWHSWRRAYSQALADADVSAQQAMLLAGHASSRAHDFYLRRSAKAVTAPEGAMPQIFEDPGVSSATKTEPIVGEGSGSEKANELSGADGTRTRGLRRDRRGTGSHARAS